MSMTILWTIGNIGLRINSFDFKPLTEYTKKKRKLKQLLTDVLEIFRNFQDNIQGRVCLY